MASAAEPVWAKASASLPNLPWPHDGMGNLAAAAAALSAIKAAGWTTEQLAQLHEVRPLHSGPSTAHAVWHPVGTTLPACC